MEISYHIIKDNNQIKRVVEECDSAFIVGLTCRDNYQDILLKMQKYAEVIIVENSEGILLGYASMYANNLETKTAFISMFGIKEVFQRNHVGRRLMDKCVEVAKMKGMKQINLEVLKKNVAGNNFYINYGFRILKEYTEESYIMRFQLD